MTKKLIQNKISGLIAEYSNATDNLAKIVIIFKLVDYLKREPLTNRLIEPFIDNYNNQIDNAPINIGGNASKNNSLAECFNNLFVTYLMIDDLLTRLEIDESDNLIAEHIKFAIDLEDVAKIFSLNEKQDLVIINEGKYSVSFTNVTNYLLGEIEKVTSDKLNIGTPLSKIDWSGIQITFNQDEVKVKTRDYFFEIDYRVLGFVDKANPLAAPTPSWSLFKSLVESGGMMPLDNLTKDQREIFKLQKQEISENLKNFFRAENDPIKFHKPSNQYILQIQLDK